MEEVAVQCFFIALGLVLLCLILLETIGRVADRIGTRVRIAEIGGVVRGIMEMGSDGSSRGLRHPGTRHRVDIHKSISRQGRVILRIQLNGHRFTGAEFQAAQDALRQQGIAYRLISGSKGSGLGLVVDCGSDASAATAALRALFVNAWGFSFDTVLRMSAKGLVKLS